MQLSAAARTMQPNAARRPREKVREARGKVDEYARQLAGCDWVREAMAKQRSSAAARGTIPRPIGLFQDQRRLTQLGTSRASERTRRENGGASQDRAERVVSQERDTEAGGAGGMAKAVGRDRGIWGNDLIRPARAEWKLSDRSGAGGEVRGRAGGERSGALARGLGRLVSGLVWWVVAGLEARQGQPRRQTGPKERQGGIGLVWDRAFSEWSWWSLLWALGYCVAKVGGWFCLPIQGQNGQNGGRMVIRRDGMCWRIADVVQREETHRVPILPDRLFTFLVVSSLLFSVKWLEQARDPKADDKATQKHDRNSAQPSHGVDLDRGHDAGAGATYRKRCSTGTLYGRYR
ncbi:hypothetical protein EDB80DRAFT_683042 [Ilyonectria destructans]|nr:hypothetical protein EDB80DRAFT_683042 [Ilyonectria destructans]